jgi:hypothetical protein
VEQHRPAALVRNPQALRVLGPRRLVLAYSPGDDDSLLRSTVLLPGGIKKSAEGIERHTDALDATLRRLLAQAATALEGAAAAAPIDPAAPGVVA